MAKTTKTERLLNYLMSGHDITEGQARSRFGIQNLSATASDLRFRGYAVYANRRTLGNNHEVTMYRLGAPRREVIAAGYRALASA
jgi:hypothetical protein